MRLSRISIWLLGSAGGLALLVSGLAWGALGLGAQPLPLVTCQNFPQTGHQMCGEFLRYWLDHGGLAQNGYPISDEFPEVSDLNGKTYMVQYFERAVFEHHPENLPPYDVLLSQLGTFRLNAKYPAGVPAGPQVPFFEDRTGPVEALQSFYNAINRKEYSRAFGYFETGSTNQTLAQFQQGFADTTSVALFVGSSYGQGAAGSIYASVPAVIVSYHTNGASQTFYGCYVMRANSKGVSPNPADELFRIYRATVQAAPAGSNAATLLSQACANP